MYHIIHKIKLNHCTKYSGYLHRHYIYYFQEWNLTNKPNNQYHHIHHNYKYKECIDKIFYNVFLNINLNNFLEINQSIRIVNHLNNYYLNKIIFNKYPILHYLNKIRTNFVEVFIEILNQNNLKLINQKVYKLSSNLYLDLSSSRYDF